MQGIVVGGVDLGEADRIVKLLTAASGRTAILARGVRRGRKGWQGLLEPGAEVELVLRRGRGPLPLLADATPISVPRRAREDLLRLSQLAYGCELCAALAPEDHEAPKLHRLLQAWLALLEGEPEPGSASRQALEAKALTFAGLAPALIRCAVCTERLDDPVAWGPDHGGGAHGRCHHGAPVLAAALLRLEALRRTPLADTPGVAPAEPRWLLADFAEWQLGKGLNSRALLEEIEET